MQNIDKYFSKTIRVAVVVAVLFVVGLLGWKYQYLSQPKNVTVYDRQPQGDQTSEISPETPEILEKNVLAKTTIYYTVKDGEPYLKQVVQLNSNKAKYAYEDSKIITRIYSQDNASGEAILDTNIKSSEGSWRKISEDTINDSRTINEFKISDRVLSFRQIPDSRNFIFVVDRVRATDNNPTRTAPGERTIYFYNAIKSYLNKILALSSKVDTATNLPNFSYPFVDNWSNTFSGNGRYVSFNVFQCTFCSPPHPEKLLVDLISLQYKNIGRVSHFSWKENGEYEYQDYIKIPCNDDRPDSGECYKDPSLLPIKTGKM